MKGVQITLYILAILKLSSVNPLKIKSLEGAWELNDKDGNYKKLSATVPGGIYTDLMNNNILNNVFYMDNDMKSRWAAKKTWLYTKHFQVDEEYLNHKYINVVFEGVDTFSKIYINNVLIGTTVNMFVRYDYKIKNLLKPGINNITVEFNSPIKIAKELSDIQSQNYTVFPECVPSYYNGECHANHIRKMQASFGWDWGPAFPSVGIWKRVYLEAYNDSVIRDVTLKITEDTDNWKFEVTTYFAKNDERLLKGNLVITIFTDLDKVLNMFSVNLVGNEEFTDVKKFNVVKEHFSLWWPNGMGEQNLYTMKVTFANPDGSEQSNKRFRIGLRTVEVVQDKMECGRSFYFKINGVKMFAKGTNMIPTHILPELAQNETQIRFLLQSSKDVHMNMIRVWGGGMYESDTFYEVADEMGILIWQDFMFACSMYPTNREFLETVKDEVQHQVRRLQHHPSIAIWAGNNENEVALRGNWYGTSQNFSLYKEDYVNLYAHTIKPIVEKNDKTRYYLTSSPTNGIQSDEEGYVAKNPYDPLYGDVHYYNYMADSWDPNTYPVPRFSSEYGFQSLPSVKSIMSATNSTSDLAVDSEFMLHRQHHVGGYNEILNLIRKRLNLPDNTKKFNKAFIFYSQISQAMAIKIQTEHYRQWYSKTDEIGQGNTMGALYWQLNDVWIAPSWAGIDFQNRWKMQHYYAKEFFAPIIVSAHLSTNHNASIYIVSDLSKPTFNATLILTTYKWTSFEPVATIKKQVDITTGSKMVHTFWTNEYFETIDCGPANSVNKNCFMLMSLKDGDKHISPVNIMLPSPLKETTIKNATVEISYVNQISDKKFLIEISTDAIAAFVWLECDVAGQFSENGFFLYTKKRVIAFTATGDTTLKGFKKSVTVTHLLDSYYF